MKYLLLNRENVVVDILDNVRYLKLQPGTGLVIGCEREEGTGVLSSDCKISYTLSRADMNNDINAVNVMEVEEVPSEIAAGLTVYNRETGEFEPRYSLEEMQAMKQEENKQAFAAYLASHPMTWTDGKEYGITQEDQSEISLNLNQYTVAVQAGVEAPILEWHARREECRPWDIKELTALSLAITGAVYPIYHLMQQYKTAIYSATSIDEVNAIELNYETEDK